VEKLYAKKSVAIQIHELSPYSQKLGEIYVVVFIVKELEEKKKDFKNVM
jgi:hypothetical protein